MIIWSKLWQFHGYGDEWWPWSAIIKTISTKCTSHQERMVEVMTMMTVILMMRLMTVWTRCTSCQERMIGVMIMMTVIYKISFWWGNWWRSEPGAHPAKREPTIPWAGRQYGRRNKGFYQMIMMVKTTMLKWAIVVWAQFSLHLIQCGVTWRGGPHVRHRPPEISRDKWGQLSLTQRFSNVTCIFTSVEIRQRLVESCQITNQFRVFGDCSAVGEFYGGSWWRVGLTNRPQWCR